MGRRMRMPGHGWSHDRDTIREMADACARRSAALLCGSAFLSSGNGNARAAEPQRFVVSIKSRKVEPAQKLIRVTRGDAVELEFSTDEEAELHLHGYDRLIKVEP